MRRTVLSLCGLLALTSSAGAQTPEGSTPAGAVTTTGSGGGTPSTGQPPSPEAQANAQRFYELGVEHFRKGDHERAVVEFTKAYRIDPSPTLVFNMARAFEEMERYGPAREFYQRYLELAPQAPDRRQVEDSIAALGHLAARQPADPEPIEPRPGAAPASTPAPGLATVAPPPEDDGGGPLMWVTFGTGVAALGGFAVLGALANGEQSSLDDLRKDPDRTQAAWDATRDRGAQYAMGADILLVVGLAATTAAVFMATFGRRRDVEWTVGPNGVGGRF